MSTAARVKQGLGPPDVRKGQRGRVISKLLAGTLVLFLPALTACQPKEAGPQLPAVTQEPGGVLESSRKYSPVIGQIRQALEGQFPGIGWEAAGPASLNRQDSGECTLFLPAFHSDGNLVKVSEKFRHVMDALNPVLEPNGFSTVAVLDEATDGWWSVTSGNAQGANVTVSGRTDVELSLRVPVDSESCSPNELTALEG